MSSLDTRTWCHHIDTLMAGITRALDTASSQDAQHTGLIIAAGTERQYAEDDRPVPFRTFPHFSRFAPVEGAGHLLTLVPGQRPRLVRVVPEDFWHALPDEPDHPYREAIDVIDVPDHAAALKAVGPVDGFAALGDEPSLAERLGLSRSAFMPRSVVAALDWERRKKTPWEQACLRESAAVAAIGHAAVRAAVRASDVHIPSEFELNHAYLAGCRAEDQETPYRSIIAWNEHAAILHYQSRSRRQPTTPRTLLIDAGATHFGYATDVTRTYVTPKAHPVFAAMVDQLDALQRQLVGACVAGADFGALHDDAMRGIAGILSRLGVVRLDADAVYDARLCDAFFPHGLGHHLGLQTHDVSGWQADPTGRTVPPPERYPFLRNTGTLEAGHVVTIEPGIYFIPMWLDPLRGTPEGEAIDWSLVDTLIPCGGIRIEDDVLVTEGAPEDLTRGLIPGQ